ncbi:hypothetical protein PSAC2689_110147 [Paraburkholderia sacchari]
MSLIVASRFTTFVHAEAAIDKLHDHGFVDEDLSLFCVNPGGQHARFPVSGAWHLSGLRIAGRTHARRVSPGPRQNHAGLCALFHRARIIRVLSAYCSRSRIRAGFGFPDLCYSNYAVRMARFVPSIGTPTTVVTSNLSAWTHAFA